MEQKSLANWLKVVILAVGVVGATIFLGLLPMFAMDIVESFPSLAFCYWPWMIFIWIAAIPCYGVLVLGWQIADSIGKDQSFTVANAVRLKKVSILAIVDSLYFFVGNVVYLFLNMNHPGIIIVSLFVIFIAIVIAVVMAILSHLVNKAAVLQEQTDLTI